MKFSKLLLFTAMVLVLSVVGINAQGRGGGGNRGGGGGGMGGGMGGGRPTMSPGIDRGIDMSSDRSMGRSDKGRSTASDRSNGRSDNGMNTARNAPSDSELPKFNGISKKLGTTPAGLRTAYQAALAANPNLKFGEFVSANVVASNLNKRFPNVTTSAILLGLQNDRSLGQTLHDLGVGSDAAKTAMKNAKEEIRDSENH